jgi:hypothetical protein
VSPLPLRFTGEYPPVDVLERLPNWEYAVDEENIDGQDETTIRPSNDQDLISNEVAFTAGVVWLANGTCLPAILEVNQDSIEGFTVYANGAWAWTLRRLGRPPKWEPITYDWLPEGERPVSVALSDSTVFPLVVETTLPFAGGSRGRVTVAQGEAE